MEVLVIVFDGFFKIDIIAISALPFFSNFGEEVYTFFFHCQEVFMLLSVPCMNFRFFEPSLVAESYIVPRGKKYDPMFIEGFDIIFQNIFR